MGCCGARRMRMNRTVAVNHGKIGILVYGTVTGRRYEFRCHGHRLEVDRRDLPAFKKYQDIEIVR